MHYELTGGMWSRKFRKGVLYSRDELAREITRKGLSLNTPRMDGRIRGSRRLVAVEPGKGRIVAHFSRTNSYTHAENTRTDLLSALRKS